MRIKKITVLVTLSLLFAGLAIAKDSPDKEKEKIRKMSNDTLKDLYKLQPTAKDAIAKASGYAVFDNMGTNLLVLSTARGGGIAINNKTKKETYMKMASAGVGLGLGVKDYRVIFIFQEEAKLNTFLDSGWSGSAQTDAAAKAGTKGDAIAGAVEMDPGVFVYQITKNGLALQVTLQGTKYYKNDDLNNPKPPETKDKDKK